jgi:hypothetical protein
MPPHSLSNLPAAITHIKKCHKVSLGMNLRPLKPRFIIEYEFPCLDPHTGEETFTQLAETYVTAESDFPAVGDIIAVYGVSLRVTDTDTVSDPMWDPLETKHYVSRCCTATVSLLE